LSNTDKQKDLVRRAKTD